METLVINNFGGRLSRFDNGLINSDFAKYSTTFGVDPFSKPGKLSFYEQPVRIDLSGTIITDLIIAGKPRLESGITYLYALGHTGRVYKIQVNDIGTYDPNYDKAVFLTSLSVNSPTFKYGSSLEFYGTGEDEQIFIGHDKGVTRVSFDGATETFVGDLASYTTNVPRPVVNFLGKLYFGNGANILEIDSTLLVTTYAKLAPGFPDGTYVRDINASPDGNYIQFVVSRILPADITSSSQDTNALSSTDSYFVFWNGTDNGYTAYQTYSSYSLTANTTFGPFAYTFGYDANGAAVYEGGSKILTLPNSLAPLPNSIFSVGNLLGFASPEQDSDVLKASIFLYGKYDNETTPGLFRILRATADTGASDVAKMPFCKIVSNLLYGSSISGYTDNQVGTSKLYFSTIEVGTGGTQYRLYKLNISPTSAGTSIAGVYETQNQLFPNKISIKEVRIYTDPISSSSQFRFELIGSGNQTITNSTKTFTVGGNITANDDLIRYNPAINNSYVLGLRITNILSPGPVVSKIEIDYTKGGK